MACRRGIDLARNAETLLNELLEAPACAVTGQHGQVVQVNVAITVGRGYLLIVNFAQPVVGGDCTGV